MRCTLREAFCPSSEGPALFSSFFPSKRVEVLVAPESLSALCVSSCWGKVLSPNALWQHEEPLPPCSAVPGPGRQRRIGSRHSFKVGQSLLPTAASSAFLLFRSRTYLLSKHFRCLLPRFLI